MSKINLFLIVGMSLSGAASLSLNAMEKRIVLSPEVKERISSWAQEELKKIERAKIKNENRKKNYSKYRSFSTSNLTSHRKSKSKKYKPKSPPLSPTLSFANKPTRRKKASSSSQAFTQDISHFPIAGQVAYLGRLLNTKPLSSGIYPVQALITALSKSKNTDYKQLVKNLKPIKDETFLCTIHKKGDEYTVEAGKKLTL